VEIKCQLDATEVFIADLIACSTCFGAPPCPSSGAQEYYTVVAACGISCYKNVKVICKLGGIFVLSIKCRVLSTHFITNLDNTRHLILKTQIPPNLQITFYIFTARNTTGSNHFIIS